MPYSTLGKNLMLDALKGTNPTAPITHAGLFEELAVIEGVTGVASTDTLTKAGHGLSNGDLVVLRTLIGGEGLIEEFPYFVIGVSGDDFQLSKTPGGPAVDFASDATVSIVELVEISGGSPAYEREAITLSDAVDGNLDSSDQPVFDIPAGATVNYVGFFSAITAGILLSIALVITESFGAQGTYTLLDADLDLNA